jgi:hypothetical protein
MTSHRVDRERRHAVLSLLVPQMILKWIGSLLGRAFYKLAIAELKFMH